MKLTARRQFLLAEVKANTISCNGACLGATRKYCIERDPLHYPRAQRQPNPAEMERLRREGYITVRRMTVTITAAGRKALRQIGG